LNLKIVLDDKSIYFLKQSILTGSRSKLIIESALQLKRFLSNAIVTCDAAEAWNLLLYAGHCPSVVASIHKALRIVGFPLISKRGNEGDSACRLKPLRTPEPSQLK
jgi:hypothetical protein